MNKQQKAAAKAAVVKELTTADMLAQTNQISTCNYDDYTALSMAKLVAKLDKMQDEISFQDPFDIYVADYLANKPLTPRAKQFFDNLLE